MKRINYVVIIVWLIWVQPSTNSIFGSSLHELHNLSDAKRQRLTSAALAGDASAALLLSNYYADRNPGLREKFLRKAVESGSTDGYNVLMRFYVEPHGIFRPEEALKLRRKMRERSSRRLRPDDPTWIYEASIDYKFVDGGDAKFRRRRLLQLAVKLGSQRAKAELDGLPNEEKHRITRSKVPWPHLQRQRTDEE
jgi:hypothetical protein